MPAPTSPTATHGRLPTRRPPDARPTPPAPATESWSWPTPDVAELVAARDAVLVPAPAARCRACGLPPPDPRPHARPHRRRPRQPRALRRPRHPGAPLSEADLRLVRWGLGRHLGVPVSQDTTGRLLRSADTGRIDFHSGGSDVTALLVRDERRTVSLVTPSQVVDEVVLRRPDLAVRLFDTFPSDRWASTARGEALPLHAPRLLARRRAQPPLRPARHRARPAPPTCPPRAADLELFDLVDESRPPRPGVATSSSAGDLLLVNNYDVLHRRAESSARPDRSCYASGSRCAADAPFPRPSPGRHRRTARRGDAAESRHVTSSPHPTHVQPDTRRWPRSALTTLSGAGTNRKPHQRGAMPLPETTGEEHMAKGIRFYETGGPEVMQWETLEVGEPGPGEVRVRHARSA